MKCDGDFNTFLLIIVVILLLVGLHGIEQVLRMVKAGFDLIIERLDHATDS